MLSLQTPWIMHWVPQIDSTCCIYILGYSIFHDMERMYTSLLLMQMTGALLLWNQRIYLVYINKLMDINVLAIYNIYVSGLHQHTLSCRGRFSINMQFWSSAMIFWSFTALKYTAICVEHKIQTKRLQASMLIIIIISIFLNKMVYLVVYLRQVLFPVLILKL
jgi:hypothetical protein